MIKTVMFDLDGTLLPMDQEEFVKAYFGALAKKLAPYGYESKALIGAIWEGTGAMIRNDGSRTNEAAFWNKFSSLFGEEVRKDEPLFEAFYKTDFQQVQGVCGYAPEAAKALEILKRKGIDAVLATNPIFPRVATESRIRWAGLKKEDFIYFTTYENCRYCKPNLNYYREILEKIGANAEECLMVGNDVGEDMVTRSLGMQVFLLTDCLINKDGADLSQYPHGNFKDLLAVLSAL